MKIKDLDGNTNLSGVRFIYPGDGKAYYWHSQWHKGVFGKKRMDDSRVYPLFVEQLSEAMEWEIAPPRKSEGRQAEAKGTR